MVLKGGCDCDEDTHFGTEGARVDVIALLDDTQVSAPVFAGADSSLLARTEFIKGDAKRIEMSFGQADRQLQTSLSPAHSATAPRIGPIVISSPSFKNQQHQLSSKLSLMPSLSSSASVPSLEPIPSLMNKPTHHSMGNWPVFLDSAIHPHPLASSSVQRPAPWQYSVERVFAFHTSPHKKDAPKAVFAGPEPFVSPGELSRAFSKIKLRDAGQPPVEPSCAWLSFSDPIASHSEVGDTDNDDAWNMDPAQSTDTMSRTGDHIAHNRLVVPTMTFEQRVKSLQDASDKRQARMDAYEHTRWILDLPRRKKELREQLGHESASKLAFYDAIEARNQQWLVMMALGCRAHIMFKKLRNRHSLTRYDVLRLTRATVLFTQKLSYSIMDASTHLLIHSPAYHVLVLHAFFVSDRLRGDGLVVLNCI